MAAASRSRSRTFTRTWARPRSVLSPPHTIGAFLVGTSRILSERGGCGGDSTWWRRTCTCASWATRPQASASSPPTMDNAISSSASRIGTHTMRSGPDMCLSVFLCFALSCSFSLFLCYGLRDVITSRCAWSPLYGRPAAISTVDKYVSLRGRLRPYVYVAGTAVARSVWCIGPSLSMIPMSRTVECVYLGGGGTCP